MFFLLKVAFRRRHSSFDTAAACTKGAWNTDNIPFQLARLSCSSKHSAPYCTVDLFVFMVDFASCPQKDPNVRRREPSEGPLLLSFTLDRSNRSTKCKTSPGPVTRAVSKALAQAVPGATIHRDRPLFFIPRSNSILVYHSR
jgi:hypothetical protein